MVKPDQYALHVYADEVAAWAREIAHMIETRSENVPRELQIAFKSSALATAACYLDGHSEREASPRIKPEGIRYHLMNCIARCKDE